MRALFAPGCALNRYKPELIEKISRFLQEAAITDGDYMTCCKAEPEIDDATVLITCCPGCSHKFELKLPNAKVLSLWKVLMNTEFPFPDYHGARMSIHDSCHARQRNSSEMQESARLLCARMNIELIEPEETRDHAVCCGGSACDYETRKELAFRRAEAFSQNEVVVYCTGCVRSFSVTGVKPRHLLDLLFEESTERLYPPRT